MPKEGFIAFEDLQGGAVGLGPWKAWQLGPVRWGQTASSRAELEEEEGVGTFGPFLSLNPLMV